MRGQIHKFPYRWTLQDAVFTKDKGSVFSCFSCGGGSTMGYKLAGFDVIGCNEIDPRIMEVYCQNHAPKYSFLEPIQEFKLRDDLPGELYNLDILDGSPPCSVFSMAGLREKAWGVEKKFKEGQKKQILDTLFFDFIDLTSKLQPKVAIAENVKGLLLGDAIKYTREIYARFDKAGYYCQHWLLDASTMGIPQRRVRVFFICLRKDVAVPFLVQKNMFESAPYIDMSFNEPPIIFDSIADYSGREITGDNTRFLWENRQRGDSDQSDANYRLFGKASNFGQSYVYRDKVSPTLTAKEDCLLHYEKPLFLGQSEVCSISSFPQDYNFSGQSPHYICGMSVPPVMVAQVASRVYEQWLSKI